ncbi:uncharacterized protein LOC104890884 [Beta vulgaris subsp. vulgaris]|uniref:uncharacterized protein LOC104890884 n=1 Tax=Beta vulgaris subsp. vulgaris TaxID=3555 RepID=UPI00254884DC|nr:uncharacterized protein LOC104890884 [Beta vulgaris subsp. vulgaris]
MTIEEANLSEEILEETLAKVQERKKELTAEVHDGEASQPSGSMFGAKNSSPKPSDEVQQEEFQHQPKEDSDKNQHHSTTTKGIQVTLMEGCQLQNLMLQMAPSPHPQHAGTSFSSLLTAVDVAETLSPIRETFYSQSPKQNNSSSFQQHQFSFSRDGLDTNIYSNGDSSGVNQTSQDNEINTFRTDNGYNNLPASDLIPQNFELPPSSASFQMPYHQIQIPMQLQAPYYQISQQMPLGSNSNESRFSDQQWCNQRTLQQNPTAFGQRSSSLNLLNSVSGLNNIYIDSRPPNLQLNHQAISGFSYSNQSMGSRSNMGTCLSLNLQGRFANFSPQAHFEVEGSPVSAQKRKLSWEDDLFVSLSSYQDETSASNNAIFSAPIPRPTRNAVYHTAYELMGLPIDPHCRNFQEMLRKEDVNRQHGNR